jgi:hypothetical protein
MTRPEVPNRLVMINAPHQAIFARLLSSDPAQQKASEYMELFRSAQAEQILSANDFEFLDRVMAFGRENGLPPEDRPEYIKAWSQPGAITGGLTCPDGDGGGGIRPSCRVIPTSSRFGKSCLPSQLANRTLPQDTL